MRKPLSEEDESVTGRACFVMILSFFVAEMLSVAIAGPLAELLQTKTAIAAIAALFGGLGAAFSFLIKAPKSY